MLFLAFLMAATLFAEEQGAELKKIEEALKTSPDDPVLHYRKCQLLFADGKEQESIDHAAVALTKFKEADQDLAWMKLGTFKTDRYRIDVHFNMGPEERAEIRDGIVRPYSFRVWTLGDEPELVRILDFELGYSNGKVVTAAIGAMTGGGHSNYGIVDPKSDFSTIKKRVVEILAR
ncbi:hypothetical protein FYK55_00410 [Roseiconus nitratireducens]|uniref:Tetratricopeptide repeat protein n=2 Tax=Roseiconus nitratireducens TaxID=2605748 RepID=A0A5M6DIC1_9BACT|nr:hypothetical protein FYK55_00410 [Roseiconus nitratireducens]